MYLTRLKLQKLVWSIVVSGHELGWNVCRFMYLVSLAWVLSQLLGFSIRQFECKGRF
jgi:hypothetical protein